jgi:flagellar biosynthetic protein FliR
MLIEGISSMMPNLFHCSFSQFESLVFIMMRVAPILFMMPLLSSRNLPHRLKAGLTLAVSFVLWPVVKVEPFLFPSGLFGFAFYMFSEFMIGFLLGLSIRLIFAGIQLAGEFIGFQMGFAMANVLDPQSGMDTTLMAQFHYLLGLLIFLSIDGHHWFFKALIQSFHLLSPGEFYLQKGLYQHFLNLSGKMFLIAIQIVAPVLAILILVQIALGLVSKMVPQVNILISSFPLTISLGLVFLGLSMELLYPYLENLFDESGRGLILTLLPLMKR